ncbi:MAG: winged helix-turn-helix domain-containing protein [Deltaproteobacteria bacterium]|nr:winged helix-turn-helix domain-containing protein [Deltaproteobacteria bacterium]MCB9786314.1 winged helix-turn-helix domain-containing protein [Deltaproteobacteria bacterium]
MASAPQEDTDFAGLVERIVPLMAELFATLAAQNPLRMYFADIAGKTLFDIVGVLRDQGISQEAIAASLGLTINGFRARMKKLGELYRAPDPGASEPDDSPRTLLERVYAHIADRPDGESFARLEEAFAGLKTDTLKGLLHFLVVSGLLSVTGRGRTKTYAVVTRPGAGAAGYHDAVVLLYREGPLTLEQLAVRLARSEEQCREWLERLRATGRLAETTDEDGAPRYRATDYHIPMDTAEGYEAALWDHLAAVVRAICKKVRLGRPSAHLADLEGGLTFSFDLPEDHPLWAEVSPFLRRTRLQMEDWLARARELEPLHGQGRRWHKVTIYAGQTLQEVED